MADTMTGHRKMNGQHDLSASPPPAHQPVLNGDTPVAYYTPIAITPNTIKWVFAAIVAALTLMPAGLLDRYLMPARQSELDQWVKVVQVLQQGQKDISETVAKVSVAVERVTLAVDNLAGIVEGIRQTQQAVRAVVPKAKR
jgi:hypothetical protein